MRFKHRYTLTLFIISFNLAACSTPIPTTTLAPVPRIVTTPALEPWLSSWAVQYIEEVGPLPFDIEVLSAREALQAAERASVELVVAGIEPPEKWFVTPLGVEGIVVVVNPANSIRDYTTSELADLFSGSIKNWDTLNGLEGEVQPVIPFQGDELRSRWEQLLLEGRHPSPWSILAPSPAALNELVSQDPAAIGILPLSQDPAGTRIVRVEGQYPGPYSLQDGRYPLILPVLAMAPQEPTGPIRDWLVWIQNQSQTNKPSSTPTPSDAEAGDGVMSEMPLWSRARARLQTSYIASAPCQ